MRGPILVTGAEGFTGRYLAAALAARGWAVYGLLHRSPVVPVDGLTQAWEADLRDASAVAHAINHVRPTHVAHLAAIAFVGHGDVDAMYLTNVLGTRHLLEALSCLEDRPSSVLLASSANVYGNSSAQVIDEDTPPAPANDYAVTKLAMEYVSKLYAGRLPILVARPFNYTGVGQPDSFLLPKIVAHARRKADAIELGNLDVARDFSDVRMVVEAYCRLLETPAAIGGTFNVCSGRAYTLHQVLEAVREVSGHSMAIRVNPALVRANDVKVLFGSRARLEACIGALEGLELRETLRWMLQAVPQRDDK
jgi:GDP-6-deoxy-D-talose 4-dehydrogenase